MNTRQHIRRRSSGGFTLVEIMVVVVIVGILIALSIGPISDSLRRGRVTSVTGAMNSCKTATVAYLTKAGSLGVIPLTDGTIPASEFTAPVTAATAATATSLDQILLTEGTLEKPIAIKMGPQTSTVTGIGTTWNPASGTLSATALPTADRSTITRLEAQMSTTTTPSTANGSNFKLDGINNLPTNARVVALIIPNVPAEDAYQLSLTVDGSSLSGATNLVADDLGSIAYAAPVNGVTTVYAYVTHY